MEEKDDKLTHSYLLVHFMYYTYIHIYNIYIVCKMYAAIVRARTYTLIAPCRSNFMRMCMCVYVYDQSFWLEQHCANYIHHCLLKVQNTF